MGVHYSSLSSTRHRDAYKKTTLPDSGRNVQVLKFDAMSLTPCGVMFNLIKHTVTLN